MDIDYLIRLKLIEQMPDEDKRALSQYALLDSYHREIMNVLSRQHEQINRMASKIERQNWYTDFGSDVAANFFTDGIIWLFGKLLS